MNLLLVIHIPQSDINSYNLLHGFYTKAVKVKESHPCFKSQVRNADLVNNSELLTVNLQFLNLGTFLSQMT